MTEKRYWYCVTNSDYTEWDNGSFDPEEARQIALEWLEECPDTVVAVIDGDYDEAGNPRCDEICIAEIDELDGPFDTDFRHARPSRYRD